MSDFKSIFKAGSTIQENCKCRTQVTGVINSQSVANFTCLSCGNHWNYALRGKGKGSSFSSNDLNHILKTRNVSINAYSM